MVLPDDMWLIIQTLVGVALVMLFLRWYEPRMVYYPHVPGRQLERTPADVGLDYQEVSLRTRDGVSLHAWFLPCAGLSRTSGLTLLFFHGNAGNISHRINKCRTFLELGLDVLVIDYRGYGRSEGQPNESGTYLDADAAYEYLTQQRQIAPDSIVLYGESLGTGIAVDLASRSVVGAVILEAPFTSLADVAQRIFWFFPVRPFVRNRYDSLRKIKQVKAPLLLLHSRQDEFFRIRHSQRLLQAATGPKRLVELEGKHAVAFDESVDVCRREIGRLLAELKR